MKHTYTLFYFCLFFLLFSCKSKSVEKLDAIEQSGKLELDTSKYALITFDTAMCFPYYTVAKVFPNSSRVATISNSELIELEKLLQLSVFDFNKHVKENNLPYDSINLSNYRIQLVVTINNSGEKEIFVNCFCSTEEDWENHLVKVLDGGECFFNVRINLSTNKYYEFSVNSLA